jgi:predicted transcriptional regulator
MAGTNSNSIAFPPDLLAAAQRYAETAHQSLAEVAEEALRTYIDRDPELNAIRQYHIARAESLHMTLDDYVMSLVKEHRRERRERQEQQPA